MPSRDQVERQLARVLGSEAFANAERASRFLRYVVERTLAGEGDRLKEFVIGVDVFDRGDQYDPRIDSIVRVEAGRLRSKLDQYYSRATDEDGVVIRIPRGSYVPTFERRALRSDPAPSQPSHAVHPVRGIRGAAAVGVFVLAGVLIWSSRSPSTSPIPEVSSVLSNASIADSLSTEPQGVASSGPPVADTRPTGSPPRAASRAPHSEGERRGANREPQGSSSEPRGSSPEPEASSPRSGTLVSVVVLPFEHFSDDREAQLLAARFTDGVTGELARIEHIGVVSRTSALQLSSEGRTLRDIARTLDAQVVVEGSLVVDGTRVHASVRLVDTVVDRKSWSRQFAAEVSDLRALQQQVAADVAAFIIPSRTPVERPVRN
jgi:TolB-like protein